jgi:RNA ligase (TIGR02306 family)
MSEFSCPVVKLQGITKHPNADKLSIVTVEGCPVIIITEDWKEGDLGIYVPVDAVVPESVPGTEFLGEHRRIRAKRLRKVFSMGLLLPMSALKTERPACYEGFDVADFLGITKYEEPERPIAGTKQPKLTGKNKVVDPKLGPVYDLESYRKYGKTVFKEGDPVVVTEKIHGTNFRFGHKTVTKGFNAFVRRLFGREPKTVFCVGSHKTWRSKDDGSVYWKVAKALDLEEKTKEDPDLCFYGEIYGSGVQDLVYGCKDGELRLGLFDVWDAVDRRWVDCDEFDYLCGWLDLPKVPVVYRGPFKAEVVEPMRNGESTIAKQIREGIVIRQEICGKTMFNGTLKLVGDDYLLRKNGTEFH